MSTKSLLFHTFDSQVNSDQFYDMPMNLYTELLIYMSQIIIPSEFTITFDDGYKSIIPAVQKAKAFGFNTIVYIITNKINQDGFLSKDEILDLALKGTIIGSHSHTHLDLSKSALSKVHEELQISRDILSKITQSKVLDFSLPYGGYTKNILKIARNYYKRIAISSPLLFREKNIIGRLAIHKSNYTDFDFISSVLKNELTPIFSSKILLTDFAKKIIPTPFYRKVKNLILSANSNNFFN